MPRRQIPRLEGRRPREADGDVERGEAVPVVRELPQPARSPFQAAGADAAPCASRGHTVTRKEPPITASGEERMPTQGKRDDPAFRMSRRKMMKGVAAVLGA